MFKRVGLLIATNIAILLVLSIAARIFGVRGDTYTGLLIMSAIFGFAGAFISLAMSKFIAKRSVGAKVITQPQSDTERWLLSTVENLSNQAGIDMPEVAIYQAQDVNAFATGARRNSSLVAVSTGLLDSMPRDETAAVLAHEIAHVANGDMVTLTLVQGVVNTFVFFLARVIGHIVDQALSRGGRGGGIGYFVTVMAAQVLLGFLASFIVMWVSRQREFRADAGSARYLGTEPMIKALTRLGQGRAVASELPESMQALGISPSHKAKLSKLLMTHPPISERIEALQQRTYL